MKTPRALCLVALAGVGFAYRVQHMFGQQYALGGNLVGAISREFNSFTPSGRRNLLECRSTWITVMVSHSTTGASNSRPPRWFFAHLAPLGSDVA